MKCVKIKFAFIFVKVGIIFEKLPGLIYFINYLMIFTLLALVVCGLIHFRSSLKDIVVKTIDKTTNRKLKHNILDTQQASTNSSEETRVKKENDMTCETANECL